MEKVFILHTDDRDKAIPRLLEQYNLGDFKGKSILVKANYNSADPYPASTHLDTLSQIVKGLKTAGAAEIELAERSGMGLTRDVLSETGVTELSRRLGFKVIDLDELDESRWTRFGQNLALHWEQGFWVASAVGKADKIVQTCCLKTHRFGGHFTLSLKNSVGLVGRYGPKDGNNYMTDLHQSRHQRLMIAETNLAYRPDLIIMDGIEAFVKGGPDHGDLVSPKVMLASKDRVAMDAVGVSILRYLGTTKEVSEGKIFHQQQIERAAELGIGVSSAAEIELVPLDAQSKEFAVEIYRILVQG